MDKKLYGITIKTELNKFGKTSVTIYEDLLNEEEYVEHPKTVFHHGTNISSFNYWRTIPKNVILDVTKRGEKINLEINDRSTSLTDLTINIIAFVENDEDINFVKNLLFSEFNEAIQTLEQNSIELRKYYEKLDQD